MNPRLIIATLVMCMALIQASAIMHLSNAGMGSPGWPDSYGVIAASGSQAGMEAGKARTATAAIAPSGVANRIHRAVANILQLLIVAVAFTAYMKRRSSPLRRPLLIPVLALILSLVLAFLGAWYGSPLRYPWIMIVNLTGGIALLALFWWLTLDIYSRPGPDSGQMQRLRPWAVAGLFVVTIQIFLGAWMDAYYAALACTGLPGCPGPDWTGADLLRGLGLLGSLQVDAAGRVITDHGVAAAIHMSHRTWAGLTLLYAGWLAWRALGMGGKLRLTGMIILAMLAIQFSLGLAMIQFNMPIAFVVAHTVTAALLVLGLLALIHDPAAQKAHLTPHLRRKAPSFKSSLTI